VDIAFIKRVYRTSIAVWIFALVMCGALQKTSVAVGITIGFGLALGSLMLMERVVTGLFTPAMTSERRRSFRTFFAIAFVKYAVFGVVLWGSLKFSWVSPVGIAIGIGLPQAVIFLKALGRGLTFGTETDGRL
jgi:hypothetical protein